MTITLNEAELAVLTAKEADAQSGKIGYWQIYSWLADLLQSAHGVGSTDPAVLWLRGATEANAGRGAFSALIRTYTATQGLLRYGTTQADSMQAASNAVAQNLINDILGRNGDWSRGQVPDIERIARSDATGVGQVLFGPNAGHSADDTAYTRNSAWSGSVLFSLLGSNQAGRLTSTGDSAEAVDSVNDWRDMLFAYVAYGEGFKAAAAAVTGEFLDGSYQLAVDLSVMGAAEIVYFRRTGLGVGSLATALPPTTSWVLRNVFAQIDSFGASHVLDYLKASIDGHATGVATTEATLNANAKAFSDALGLQGKDWAVTVLPDVNQLLAQAFGSGESALAARNALAALSPFAVSGNGLNLESRGLELVDPNARTGNLTADWLGDRAAMLAWREQYDARNVSYGLTLHTSGLGGLLGLPVSASGDVLYVDRASGMVLDIDGVDNGQPQQQVVFGSSDDETLSGAYGEDRLYGGGGNDTLNGGAGNDYLEGGSGDDILVGGAGVTTAAGGLGDDTYRYFTGDGLLKISDTQGSNHISINLSNRNYMLGSGAINEVTAGSSAYKDARGNLFALSGNTLTVAIEDGGQIVIDHFVNGDFGITLGSPQVVTPPSGIPIYTVGAPNQYIPDQDQTSENTYGWYRSNGVDGGAWLSPGAVFHRQDVEVIHASEAISNPSNLQYVYAAIKAGMGDSYITGDAGINVIYDDWVAHFDDAVTGIFGEYQMAPTMGNDHIDAGDGNDIVFTHGGDDVVDGGGGNDVLIDTHSGWEARFDTSTSYLYGWGSTEWVNQPGHSSNDQISGGTGNDYIAAHGGNQILDGGADNDELYAGAGDDKLFGGDGNDVLGGDIYLYSSPLNGSYDALGYLMSITLNGNPLAGDTSSYGNDFLDGGDGNDTLFGGGGNDILVGGAGDDRIQGDFLGTGIYSDLRAGLNAVGADPLAIQGNDVISGGSGNDEIFGGGGDDTIDGGDDADSVYGGSGNDDITGGAGVDVLVGDDLTGPQGNDTIHGGSDNDTIYGVGGDDVLYGDAGNDILVGGAGGTTPGSGNDRLDGGEGDDQLYGQDGADVLIGGAGHDTLNGDEGNDQLITDGGNDVLFGGAGDDTFVLKGGSGHVQITDDEGVNILSFGPGIGAADVKLSLSGGLAYIDFSPTDYVFMSRDTLAAIGSVKFSDGSEWSASDLAHVFEPGELTDDRVILGSGVALGDIQFKRSNQDLVLGYDGAIANWLNTASLSSRDIEYRLVSGEGYGFPAGSQALVLTNWYQSTSSSYLNQITDSGGNSLSLLGPATLAPASFSGTGGSEAITGASLADVMRGGGGNDILQGNDGDDDLSGQAGNDLLMGGRGNDVYRFNIGDGQDVIIDESGSADILRFGPGITASDLIVTESANGLSVVVGAQANGDSILISNWASGSAGSLDGFVFNDGTSLDRAAIDALNSGNHSPRLAHAIAERRVHPGQPFNFAIPSTTFSDADAGDTLTYATSQADGSALPAWLTYDPVTASFAGNPQASDIGTYDIQLIATDQAGLSVAHHFRIVVPVTVTGTSGADYLSAPAGGADVLGLAGNDTLNGSGVGDVLDGGDGNDTLNASDGDDVLIGGAGDDYLSGEYGDDVLQGGTGADVFYGGYGNDRVEIALGDGADTYIHYAWEAADSKEVIRFGAGIDKAFVTSAASLKIVSSQGGDYYALRLSYNPADSGDYIDIDLQHKVDNQYGSIPYDLLARMTLEFANGETQNVEALFDSINVPTAGNNILFQTPALLNIDGQGGNDLIFADSWLSGTGTLSGGAGNDILHGTNLADVLLGGDGNDWLRAYDGNDTLSGGAGDDNLQGWLGTNSLDGGSGDDTYLVGVGIDTITDSAGNDIADFGNFYYLANPSLQFRREGNDLVLDDSSPGNLLRVKDWYASAGNRIEKFHFAEGTISAEQVEGLVTGTNTAPGVSVPVPQQSCFYEAPLSFTIPAGTFLDTQQSATLSYSMTLSDGSALPAWLSFNASTRTLSGTPPATALGDVSLKVTATDPQGLSNSDDFVLTVKDPHLPIVGTEGNDLLIGTLHDNTIYGLGGIDDIRGGDGNDSLYGGADVDWMRGDNGADYIDGGGDADVMWGGAGDDIYIVDVSPGGEPGDEAIEQANEGTDEVRSSVSFTLDSNVENLTLTGTAAINGSGNELNNFIVGNSAANRLNGLAGADQMSGGDGDDLYFVDDAGDVVHENANEGIDEVRSSISFVLPDNVENLTLLGVQSLNATGNSAANVLTGNGGDNILDGGTGSDVLRGGVGNDTYLVDDASDVIVENANSGTDTVKTSSSFVLPDNVENLILLGSANVQGTGNGLVNSLTGNSGNNILDGGAGADVMSGGAGDDTYIVDATGESIVEAAGAGTDQVFSSATTYTLASNVENLTLTGSAAINGTGNTLDNIIVGNSANNTLSGGSGNDTIDGGGGNDSMSGGAGNDTFIVDSTSDSVSESSGQGTDTVQSSVTWILGSNVENLILTGSANIDGTGNTLANILTGNSGDNVLSGGSGADTLSGGAGNDTYVVDNTGDVVSENSNEGTDLVQAGVTYTLGANVENLLLTGGSALNGTGNTLDNVLTGNSGSNTLTGGDGNDTLDPGSSGTDTLKGGLGNDTYILTRTSGVTITENASEGIDAVNASVTHTLASNVELLFLTGGTAIDGTGNTLNNLLRGNSVNNTLAGGTGTDILEGGGGNDTLSDSGGVTLMNGGAGTDTLTSGSANDILIGGAGNDSLTTGSGADIIVFNLGDGQDTVAASTTKDNTLSLGGGAAYADLLFQKTGNDLILKMGASDQITFTGYYASSSNHSVDKLQMVIEGTADYDAGSSDPIHNRKIETFNFEGLTAAFDAARAANPSLTTWALTNALAAQYVSGSDAAAIGADLAYRYNRFGTLSDISFTPAIGILAATGFGSTAQGLQTLASLQDSTSRLA